MSTNPKLKALEEAIGKIRKEYGDESIIDMSTDNIRRVPSIPTGALPLDIALGIGGIPRGRIVELYGPESSGKTTLCYHMIAEVQKEGGTAAFIDVEHAMDAAYASNLGVDVDALLVSQPDYGEQALNIAEVLVQSGAVDLVVLDSVAALVPQAELEGQMGDQSVGLQARMMSKACRKLAPQANQNGTTIVFTNQIREKIGVFFGSPETQPGGRALKFYASVRLDIRRIETVKDGGEAVANRVRVKVVKNKVAPPYRQAEFEIVFGQGVDRAAVLVDMAVEHDLGVKKSAASHTFEDSGDKLVGRAKALAYLREHPEIADAIEGRVRAKFLEEGESAAEAEATVETEAAVAAE